MELVDKNSQLSIVDQCNLLALPRSSYYYQPIGETIDNLNLMRRIDELNMQYPFYGVRRITQELSSKDYPLNEKRIRRLMHLMDLKVIYPKPSLSKPAPWSVKYPYLLKTMQINRPNLVWSTDITYIPMEKGFMYLCAVIDWHSRYLLGWTLSNTLTADFCVEAILQCLERYKQPKVINTDQGAQFTSDEFTGLLLQKQITLSMDGKGRATDNIAIERFWRSLKQEHIYLHRHESVLSLRKGILGYIAFYNNKRKHQGLDYQTPACAYGKLSGTAFST